LRVDPVEAVAVDRPDPLCTRGPYERRGIRRAGMVMVLLGATALPSSVALLALTEGRQAPVSAIMVASAAVVLGAGIDMWVSGEAGRRTTPRNDTLMYLGLALAGVGFVVLPPATSLLFAAYDAEIGSDALRIAAFSSIAFADVLIAAGIPVWAYGAAAPEDRCR
jgi:hypothetical protein